MRIRLVKIRILMMNIFISVFTYQSRKSMIENEFLKIFQDLLAKSVTHAFFWLKMTVFYGSLPCYDIVPY